MIGALGVSGDSSCGDHNIAWRVRDQLGLDYVPAGVCEENGLHCGGASSGDSTDNIIFDIVSNAADGPSTQSMGGFGHPECIPESTAFNDDIVDNCPVGDGATEGCLDPVGP